jgi:predicted membrane-bound spermidine synthase
MNVVSSQSSQSRVSAPDATKSDNLSFYYLLFFLSGFPALLYQIVWQRALFTLYGVNVESVTMIVTVFMLGLGLGSLAGGRLSSHPRIRPLLAFGLIEFSIGVFGIASLWIFHRVGSVTAGHSTLVTGIIAFALLLIPTLLMGSTLPLLVEHVVRRTGNVGESVGSLYCVNTFGSAVACFAAAIVIMKMLGEAGSVNLACSFNLTVGLIAIVTALRKSAPARKRTLLDEAVSTQTIPFRIGVLLAGITGFVALAYEIIWYRLYSFTTGGKASSFALLLGFYLIGIAYGSLAVRDACRKKLGNNIRGTLGAASTVVLLGTIAAFLLGPALAHLVVHIPYEPTFVFVFIAAALLGSAFPLLAHAAIGPGNGAGKSISYLYLSNIIGSTLGSFLIGFIVLDHWSTRTTSTILLGLGFVTYLALVALSRPIEKRGIVVAGSIACLILALSSKALYSGMYERLLAKSDYKSDLQFADLVENRSGLITVMQDGTIFGGGVYDGRFNTDLINDTNGIFRAFAVAGLHAEPTNVLIIGLSSGSWAQVVANNPAVKDITIVEINPGYLPLIRKHGNVESLLRNPKVHLVIDDGRRWLVSHPNSKFDFILMNTSYHWRANVSNLLSQEFLNLVRPHLNPGGILYYNTTWSEEVMATGASVFPYSLRIANFLAVSDTPFALDKERWKEALTSYRLEGKPVFDLSNPLHRERLEEILSVADEPDAPKSMHETRAGMLKRLVKVPIITDDNMGTEWK